METEELLNRLQALEQRNAEQDRNNAVQSFINSYGSGFSSEPGLGGIIYDELSRQLGAGEISAINQEATDRVIDGLLDDIDMLQKYLKRSRRMEEDMLDELQDRVQNVEDSKTDANNPADSETLPEAPAPEMPADIPPAPEAPVPEMPAMPEGWVPPAPDAMQAPADMPADIPPAQEAPAPEVPAEVPSTPAAPVSEQQPMVSDERLKNIKSRLFKSKKPEGMKIDASIINACGGK